MSCEGATSNMKVKTDLQELAYHRLQTSSYTPLWAIWVSPRVQGAVHSVWEGRARGRVRGEEGGGGEGEWVCIDFRPLTSVCIITFAKLISCLLGRQPMRVQKDPFLVQTLERWVNCNQERVWEMRRLGTRHTPGVAAIFSSVALSNTICLPTDSTPCDEDFKQHWDERLIDQSIHYLGNTTVHVI